MSHGSETSRPSCDRPLTVQSFPGGAEVERRDHVEVVPLAEVFDELTVHVPSSGTFLKVDTQGFDDRVLSGAGDRLEGIDGLQL